AIPAYQDYTIRAQVSEGLNLSAGAKAAVSEYFMDRGVLPLNNSEAGIATQATQIQGNYVSQLNVAAGVITVTYSNAAPQSANLAINGSTLTLTPNTANPGAVDWDCSSANLAAKHLPSACR
ncbi:MAG: pilin, partial [Gammaproteobacteria bacterium]|nr:pilin [Gammaproteobacteria bacterium]